jgi:hypothetical protein
VCGPREAARISEAGKDVHQLADLDTLRGFS